MKLADDLTLPLEAVTRRLAILAMSGAGKSNAAVVLAEQMFDAGVPWVAIDPKGDWWGVRSSQDGKGAGLPVPILGGLHGDIPLEPTAGKLIADLVVDQRLTCILDISEFAERQQLWAFLIDFGETLLRRNRQALHLFLEEADEYLPQKTSEKGNLPKCLGVWQRVVKRGRFRGIGSTQVTQRNASLNKDTLYQAELLVAMRATGKADRDAVKGWVEYHNAAADIATSLPTLEDGEAWVSSPAWLKLTKRVRFHRRRTFDSGATPVLLKGRAPAATLADVDLGALQQRMAATIEKAKAEDPRELRKELAQKDKRLKELEAKAANISSDIPKSIPAKPVLTHTDRALLEKLTNRFEEMRILLTADRRRYVDESASTLTKALEMLGANLDVADQAYRDTFLKSIETKGFQKVFGKITAATTATAAPSVTGKESHKNAIVIRRDPRAAVARRRVPARVETADGDLVVKAMHRKMLTALAEHPKGLTKRQILIITTYASSGPVSAAFADLARSGLVVSNGPGLVITEAGMAALGDYNPLPTGDALRAYLLSSHKLSVMEKALLGAVCAAYPIAISKREILDQTGYASSGPVSAAFARLVAFGYVVSSGPSLLSAAEELFD